MMKETVHEKQFHNMLDPELSHSAQVSMKYQDYLQIISNHLKTLYGEFADWRKCLQQHFTSNEYKELCHSPQCCEDIPILTRQQIMKMIKEDEEYHHQVNDYLAFFAKVKNTDAGADPQCLFHAGELLGIMPDQRKDGLYRWLISREKLDNIAKKAASEHIQQNLNLLFVVESLFSTLLTPGIQLTFPSAETAMTQQKQKYYFRGENAYYGSSKPSFYRQHTNEKAWILANRFVMDEACFFLDQFDAVKYWAPSAVNYVALAQHYGIRTPMMDITSNFKVALFFACCKYQGGKWCPLDKSDFAKRESRFLPVGGDSRYGIIYRTPTEITDMKWALADDNPIFSIITPIGYQPFMRCSSQHGYMLLAKDAQYDMLKDPLFDKFRVELDEDLCHWIFDEMEQGHKVYPNDDIPHLEQYMQQIRDTHVISQRTFIHLVDGMHWSDRQTAALKMDLKQIGYSIASGQKDYITYNKLHKINRQYSIDVAKSKLGEFSKSQPMISLPSNLPVEV